MAARAVNYDYDENDYEEVMSLYYNDGEDLPNQSYYESPNHNPQGVKATGQKLRCPDGKYRCWCVCHCVYCISE